MSQAKRSAPVSFGSIRVRTPLCLSGQRIGLLGGSFNPPHAAHALISKLALARLGLDQLWWLVTPGNPLKSKYELASEMQRLELSRALVHNPRIKVTAFEAELPSAYTAATLAFLKRRYPSTHFVWLMGADNLAGFHRWQHWRQIASLMPIAVIDRPGFRMRALAGPAATALSGYRQPEAKAERLALMPAPAWMFLTGPLSPLSSTEIRRKKSLGEVVAQKS